MDVLSQSQIDALIAKHERGELDKDDGIKVKCICRYCLNVTQFRVIGKKELTKIFRNATRCKGNRTGHYYLSENFLKGMRAV